MSRSRFAESLSGFGTLAGALLVAGCGARETGAHCGSGTVLVGGECVVDDVGVDGSILDTDPDRDGAGEETAADSSMAEAEVDASTPDVDPDASMPDSSQADSSMPETIPDSSMQESGSDSSTLDAVGLDSGAALDAVGADATAADADADADASVVAVDGAGADAADSMTMLDSSGDAADGAVDAAAEASVPDQACPTWARVNCGNECVGDKTACSSCSATSWVYPFFNSAPFPVLVRTPSHPGQDPTCGTCTAPDVRPAYAIQFQSQVSASWGAPGGVVIYAHPPWYVYELPTPGFCHPPTTPKCAFVENGNYFIIATDDPDAPAMNISVNKPSSIPPECT